MHRLHWHGLVVHALELRLLVGIDIVNMVITELWILCYFGTFLIIFMMHIINKFNYKS